MVPDTVSRLTEGAGRARDWFNRRQPSLTTRILLVNVLTLALFAGGLFFLDSFRTRLLSERMATIARHAELVASALPTVAPDGQQAFLDAVGQATHSRVRLYDANGPLLMDSATVNGPAFTLRTPAGESWDLTAARLADRGFDLLVGARRKAPFVEPAHDSIRAWPEIAAAPLGGTRAVLRRGPDDAPIINAAARSAGGSYAVLLTHDADDLREAVRAERSSLALYFLAVLLVAVLLSLFLARTIVRPIHRLAVAAIKVRRGRAREVTVPRLPDRRDEIGMLARAISDMSTALSSRLDATEAFAADVAHEIKNPLASLRSALDSLEGIDDPELKQRLVALAQDDVHRLDRLISDISEASRIDAQLARAQFERIDIARMLEQLVSAYAQRGSTAGPRVELHRPPTPVWVMGEDIRLERALANVVDNALSFSPPGGLVRITLATDRSQARIMVEDDGPGVPRSERSAIFQRFHSSRPQEEDFGRHSGLGLAIARTIVEGHQGRIGVSDRADGRPGACFTVRLPLAPGETG